MRQFAVDSAGRLLVLSWVADRDWRRALDVARRTPDGETFLDTRLYFDTRLDVFSLKDRVYYGSYRWDDDTVRLLNRGGEVLVQLVEHDASANRTLALYRLHAHTQSGG
jgi:hypothetical protein